MIVGEKIRLYPTKEQEQLFWKFAGAARFTYNTALAHKIDVYQSEGYSCSWVELLSYMQELKHSGDYDWLKSIPWSVIKQAVLDLDTAYKRFFQRSNKGFPKFKKKDKCTPSFYQRPDGFHMIDSYHIKITGIKDPVRIKWHDAIWQCRNPRVTYDGKYWYFSYSHDVEDLPKSESDEVIGVDLGIKNLAVTSDGVVYKNINKSSRVRQLEKRLRHLQRQVSKKYEENKQGNKYVKTENIHKLEYQIKMIHRRLKNIRDTYIHQVTYDLVKTKPHCIVIEDLNVSGMMKNKHLSKAIQKQEFYKFRQYLTYKCQFYGVELIVADRFFASSKTCSCCGYKKQFLSLSERVYICPDCGAVIDRDLNAAINLKNYALAQ